MKKLNWPTDHNTSEYMAMRQRQNRAICWHNSNENWMRNHLATTELQWTRQAQWGMRLFDFWSHVLGCAVEVDGPEHHSGRDQYRDEYNFRRSAIVVLRVQNKSEPDATRVLGIIAKLGVWKDRRQLLGVDRKHGRRYLASLPYRGPGASVLQDYIESVQRGREWSPPGMLPFPE